MLLMGREAGNARARPDHPASAVADDEWRERFLREARAAAQLSHLNIVPIYRADEADEADGLAFLVMGYADGESLAERVQARGPLPASDVVPWLRVITGLVISWRLPGRTRYGAADRPPANDSCAEASSIASTTLRSVRATVAASRSVVRAWEQVSNPSS